MKETRIQQSEMNPVFWLSRGLPATALLCFHSDISYMGIIILTYFIVMLNYLLKNWPQIVRYIVLEKRIIL